MRSPICAATALAATLACEPAMASETPPERPDASYRGPLVAGIGLGVLGGGVGMLVAAESRGVTMGGSLIGAFGTGGLMGGVVVWMLDDLSAEEAEDKVRQGGVALTTVGLGSACFGGMMVTSSFSDASDVNDTTRVAGIIAAGAGGAALVSGVIMYAVGGPPKETEKAAWQLDAGPGEVMLTVQF